MLRERRQLSRIVGSHFLRESENKNRILLGDHSVLDPPDSIPNSEVKRNSVDGSVGSPHVRVEHRQALIYFHFLKVKTKAPTSLAIDESP